MSSRVVLTIGLLAYLTNASAETELMTNINPPWLGYFGDFFKSARPAALPTVVHIESLRRWSLSEVVRVRLADGRTFIAKKGTPLHRPSELEIYQQLLIPARIEGPKIFAGHHIDFQSLMLMEDLKGATVEQHPRPAYYLEAARQLAHLRILAAKAIEADQISRPAYQRHYIVPAHFTGDLAYLLEVMDLKQADDHQRMKRVAHHLPEYLEHLYKEAPTTLNHNDYHGKNLIVSGNRLVPVDWANAALSPHLGDLYCLIQEAKDHGLSQIELIAAYRSQAHLEERLNEDRFAWHLNMGRLCWTIRSLRWIVEFGPIYIPGSENWAPDMVADILDQPSSSEAIT